MLLKHFRPFPLKELNKLKPRVCPLSAVLLLFRLYSLRSGGEYLNLDFSTVQSKVLNPSCTQGVGTQQPVCNTANKALTMQDVFRQTLQGSAIRCKGEIRISPSLPRLLIQENIEQWDAFWWCAAERVGPAAASSAEWELIWCLSCVLSLYASFCRPPTVSGAPLII